MEHVVERWTLTKQDNEDLCTYAAHPGGEADIYGNGYALVLTSYRRGARLAAQLPPEWVSSWNATSAAHYGIQIVEDVTQLHRELDALYAAAKSLVVQVEAVRAGDTRWNREAVDVGVVDVRLRYERWKKERL